MNDLEYVVKMMMDAFRKGDVQALESLADLFGVKIIRPSDPEMDLSKWFADMRSHTMNSFGIPSELLR
jgi:hypothetical protein